MSKIQKLKKLIKSLSKKQLYLGALLLLIILVTTFSLAANNDKVQVITVERGNVTEEVLVTGSTKSSLDVDLAFERGGRVVRADVEVGDKVAEGQILAMLDQSDLLASRRKAEANLSQAIVELESTKRKSISTSDTAYATLVDSIRSSYIKADDAIRNETDQFFDNPRESNARFAPSIEDGGTLYTFGIPQRTVSELSGSKIEIESLMTKWESEIRDINKSNVEELYRTSKSNLLVIQRYLDSLATAINAITVTDFQYVPTVQGFKTTVAGARTEIITSLSGLNTSYEKYANAPYLTSSGSNESYDDVLTAEARAESYRGDLEAIEADLSKTVLRAPISGTVTMSEAKRGEIVTIGSPLISVISEDKLRIEANISEINIGKVKVGNAVIADFDAYDDKEFHGKVIYIDPGETLIDGVATYKVTISLDETYPELRSGLTANLRILTDNRDNVIKIPSYAIKRTGDKYIVSVRMDGEVEEREVTIGLKGTDATVEVTSGLEIGEEILIMK